jgi:hypothetical protein
MPEIPNGTPLLGEIVTWDLRTMEVPHSQVREALTSAGLDSALAGDLRAQTAFRRACKEFKEGRTIDRLDYDKASGVVRFQFTKKHLEESLLEFDFECIVVLNTASGEITCEENAQIAEHAKQLFDHAVAHRTTSDVTRLVQHLFETHADLYPINPRKGVAYFVPERFRAFSGMVERFLSAMGGDLLRFPVPKGTAEGNRSVREAVEAGLLALTAELDAAVTGWDAKTRSDSVTHAAEKWQVLRHKAEAYSEYLGDRQAKLLAKLDASKEALAAKVLEMTLAKDGASDDVTVQ